MSVPLSCRHCTNMTCGDHNYCYAFDRLMTDGEISASSHCIYFEWTPIDAVTFENYAERPKAPKGCEGQMRLEVDG